MSVQPFLLDGIAYNVHVMSLTRLFSVLDTDKSGRVLAGDMYRDIVGTYYNYTMTVGMRGDDVAALDAFWDAISKPEESHVCVFPYNQKTLTQRMYVTSGSQDIIRLTESRTYWGEIKINFIAMSPKVVP